MKNSSLAADPLELAARLIRCPSVTPDCQGALDLLQDVLRETGFSCRRMPFSDPEGSPDVDNLYARFGTAGRNLCFAGHVDVVPPGGGGAQWQLSPFSGLVADGFLHGRGAADMKGAVACWVAAAARFIREGGMPADGSLSLLITGDEEGPAVNGTVKMLQALEESGEILDACITGEPTNPDRLGEMVKIGRRGCLHGRLTAYGVQGHTGYPHLADNAAHRMVRMLSALLDWRIDAGTEYFEPSTLVLSTIDIGNDARNIIPDRAHAAINLRFNDLHSSATLEKHLRSILDRAVGPQGRYDLKISVTGEPFLTRPGPLSDLVVTACEAVTGLRPVLGTAGGTSDSRFIRKYCPVLDFGLVGQTMHQVDERVAVADITALTEIYYRIIKGYFAA